MNEIDWTRAESPCSLRASTARPTRDAAWTVPALRQWRAQTPFDVVIANPPFGAVRGAAMNRSASAEVRHHQHRLISRLR